MYGRPSSLPTTVAMEAPPLKTHNLKTWLAYLNHYIPVIHEAAHSKIITAQRRQQTHYNQ
ncbi:hypothetical protein BX666DRAFT_1845350, partial [Dichotomocladium elegans]